MWQPYRKQHKAGGSDGDKYVSAKTGNLTAAGSFKADDSSGGKGKAKTDNYIKFGYGLIHRVIVPLVLGYFNWRLIMKNSKIHDKIN
jgi:hypothetical protein